MRRPTHFILGPDHKAMPCDDLRQWARWFEQNTKRVGYDILPNGYRVSTVFLGADHNFLGVGPPMLFETMVFGPAGYDEVECCRYATWADAEAGHAAIKAKTAELAPLGPNG